MPRSEKRIAQIASLPARVDTLERCVESLYDQMNMIFVALNGYKDVPNFLLDDKIVYALMDNSLGDSAKFYDIDSRRGFLFTCDDDLVYPKDYADYMIDGIKRHGGIVTLLGKRYDNRPVQSFRKGYSSIYRCLTSVKEDKVVHVGGTGAMAFHSADFKISIDDFGRKNMADIWVAKKAAEQGVTITVLKHPARYVGHKTYPWRIWVKDGFDKYQTEVINSFLNEG
jgi:hypothetical protein